MSKDGVQKKWGIVKKKAKKRNECDAVVDDGENVESSRFKREHRVA